MPTLDLQLEARPPIDLDFRLDTDATLPSLEVQIFDQGSPVDITGATVKFSMEDLAGTPKVTDATVVLVDALQGIVRYDWAAADVNTTGIFIGQFEITIGTRKYLQPNNAAERLRILIGPVETTVGPPLPSTILHAPNHIRGGPDIIDADRLVITFNPTNYTPDASPPEAGDVDDLTAHLKGIDDAILSGNAVPSQLNKDMTPSSTASDGDAAIGAPGIVVTPSFDGYVAVMVNGQICHVGDGVKTTECYFSGDGGTTARLIDDIISGDTLHWNGSIAKYEITISDRLEFLFAA